MHKKVHKYSALTRGLMLALFFSVATIQSCQRKAKKKIETKEKETRRYNQELSNTLEQAWKASLVIADDLTGATKEELKQMIEVITQFPNLIKQAELDELDPALETFFNHSGTQQELVPEIAFKKILPTIPETENEAIKKLAKELILEQIKLFTVAFEKCKDFFVTQKKSS